MPDDKLDFKRVSLPCAKSGSSPLFTANLFRGGCPHACAYCYASGFKCYADGGPRPISLESIKYTKKWPQRLFLSSASDPFHPQVVTLAEELLRRALAHGSFLVISTKALASQKIVDILSNYPENVSYTISVSSLSEKRNNLLEPNAPSAMQRLDGIKQLVRCGIQVTLKADTLFPDLDDNEWDILKLLLKAKECGAQAVTFSYVFYRNRFKKKLFTLSKIKHSLDKMNEYQPIASGKGYSLPLADKNYRLIQMARIASGLGIQVISTCKCKNHIQSIPDDVPLRLDCHFHDKWW